MWLISVIVRQFFIPNPFDALTVLPQLSIAGVSLTLTPDILNWLASGALVPFTYAVVGIFYDRGSSPSLGSFLFLLFYFIHTGIIYLVCTVNFALWAQILAVVGYIALLIGGASLRYRTF